MSETPDAVEKGYSLGYIGEVGRAAIIRIKAIPEVENPWKWAVMLESGEYDLENYVLETHEIARIDNYHERPVHIHRKFEEGETEEELRHLSFHEAREYLEDNCEEFMRKYFEE